MNLMISEGRGEDHHSLLLTIKIRLASTVSTLASVKAWQGREGRQPPRSAPPFHPVLGCLRVCHVNYGDPTVPFTDCSVLKDIDNPFFYGQHCNRQHLQFCILATCYCCFHWHVSSNSKICRAGIKICTSCETEQSMEFYCLLCF